MDHNGTHLLLIPLRNEEQVKHLALCLAQVINGPNVAHKHLLFDLFRFIKTDLVANLKVGKVPIKSEISGFLKKQEVR